MLVGEHKSSTCVWDKRMRKWGSDDAFGSLVCGRSGKVSSQGGSCCK